MKFNQRGITPIISIILIVVVAVILVVSILSFSTDFTNKSLDKTKNINDLSSSDAEHFIYPKAFSDGVIQFDYSPPSNLSTEPIVITKYKILFAAGESEEVEITPNYTLVNGQNILNLVGFSGLNITDNKISVQLLTSDGKYILISNVTNSVVASLGGGGEVIEEPVEEPCTTSGDGSALTPYILCVVEDLNNIRNDLDANYVLGRDINFFNPAHWTTPPTDIATTTANWNSGAGFIPIGTSVAPFIGILDGNYQTISNLYTNRSTTDYVGLFGYTSTGARINNLSLIDVNVIGKSYVGGLVGYQSRGLISKSSSSGFISGTDYVGGLVGNIYAGGITDSYSNSSVIGSNNVGGFIGSAAGTYNTTSSISNNYSTGSVSGTGNSIGGLIGNVQTLFTVSNSYSTSSVLGSNYVGGLVGNVYSEISAGVRISTSYSSGFVRGPYNLKVGGLIGYASGYKYITNSFWDMNTSGQTTSSDGVGKTTTEMKTQSTFTSWNFTTPWNISAGESYPYLITNEQLLHPTPIAPPSPILIYTASDLNNIRNNISLTAYYALANDIDLGVSPYNSGSGWEPIGTSVAPFAGILDGNGYTISNLYINRSTTDYVGLFGYINKYAIINDLILEDINVIGQNYVGGLVGYQSYGFISLSSSSGTVSGTVSYVGGLVGTNSYGLISSSSSSGIVFGTVSYVGGLVGYISAGEIINSHSDSSVSGSNSVGGFIGYAVGTYNTTSSISNNYSTGSVSGTGNSIGGLIGNIQTLFTVSNSYSTSSVSGDGYVGGLVGYMYSEISSGVRISTSYSSGFVRGPYNRNVGGLIGYASGYKYITNSFWDMNTSGQTTSSDGVGKTTTEMKTQSTFTSWNFTTPWNISAGTSYPYLITNEQLPHPTSIAPPSPILIYTASDLNNIRNNISSTAYYALANDIDLGVSPYNTGSGWEPIGTSTVPFAGTLDGNGYTISNLYINRSTTDYVGLFGYTNKYAIISNLILEDINVIGKNYTGGITGYQNSGLITGSSITGAITGYDYVGGISGFSSAVTMSNSYSNSTMVAHDYAGGLTGKLYGQYSSYYAYILNSYSVGTISGRNNIGGAIGAIQGYTTISNNYSTTNTSGTSYIGGFAGYTDAIYNYTSISNCYSKGAVTGTTSGGFLGYKGSYVYVTNSYYDTNTSGKSDTGNATPKTTTEMKTQGTFTSWNFTTDWNITAGTTYPYLRTNTQSPTPQ